MLHNIINNAIKYTPNEGSIEIASYQEGKKAIFTVDDSGQGIPDDEYEKVFSRFYRLSRDEKSSEIGSGLGLAIVKHIVDLHQGEIQLMRSKLGGLQVKVILPLKYDEKSIIENKR